MTDIEYFDKKLDEIEKGIFVGNRIRHEGIGALIVSILDSKMDDYEKLYIYLRGLGNVLLAKEGE